jgi:hypothetical protein
MVRPYVVVGARVHARAWVLPHWLAHLADQGAPARMHLLLNYGASDDATLAILEEAAVSAPWGSVEVLHDRHDDHVAARRWDTARYATMARLRNRLLERVRELAPEYYLFCDTDMLLPPAGLPTLIAELWLAQADGIAPLAYMTEQGTCAPNCMDETGSARPQIQDATFDVPASFGVVLMTPALHRGADYAVHPYGEDLGWAHNARVAGLRPALCPRVKAKHVMHPRMLEVIDERVGF